MLDTNTVNKRTCLSRTDICARQPRAIDTKKNTCQNLQEVESANEIARIEFVQPITVKLVESGADVSDSGDGLQEI
jgi:hypothetical protein